jgi:hypothetical protein
MLRLALILSLVATGALAQQVPWRQPRPDGNGPSNLVGSKEHPIPPEQPLFRGPLSKEEVDMIILALERLKREVVVPARDGVPEYRDEETIKHAEMAELALAADWKTAIVNLTLLPTIGLALSRATNVEVDRLDGNDIMIIDREASQKASEPYCDLIKKINRAGICTVWVAPNPERIN